MSFYGKPNEYTVTLDRQSGSGGSSSVKATYDADMPSATMPTRTGYTFGGYYTETDGGGTQYYTEAGASAKKWDIDEARTLYAKWTPSTYTVTLDQQEGGGGTTSVNATYGTALQQTIATPTREGYRFDGYFSETNGRGTKYYDLNGVAVVSSSPFTADTTIYACWIRVWNVTFELNGASFKGGNGWTTSTNYEEGVGLTLPTGADMTYANHTFDGWTELGSSGYVAAIGPSATGDKTFIARWSGETYTVMFNKNDGTDGYVEQEMSMVQTEWLKNVSELFTREGYSFVAWNTVADGSGTPYPDHAEISTANLLTNAPGAYVTLYAQWTQNPYEVAFNPHGADGGETMANQSFIYDVTQNLDHVAFTYTGYAFEHWSSDTNYNNQTAYYADCAEVANLATGGVVTLYANWTGIVYTVSFDANGGTGAMDPLPCTYDMPTNLPACAFARDGWGFKGWAADGAEGVLFADGARVTNLTATAGEDVALIACWTGVTYAVTLDARDPRGDGEMTISGGEAVSVLTNLYTVGEEWNLPTPTNVVNEHLSFAGWKYVNVQGQMCDLPDVVQPPSHGITNLVAVWSWVADDLAVAVDAPELEFDTFGTKGTEGKWNETDESYRANWFVQSAEFAQGGTNEIAVQSGVLHEEDDYVYASWLTTIIQTNGVLSFWWKCSAPDRSQNGYGDECGDALRFGVCTEDGGFDEKAMVSGVVDWVQVVFTNDTGKAIKVAWKFQYDYYGDGSGMGGGTGWVDRVEWVPAGGTQPDDPQPGSEESVISFNANGGVLEAESASMTVQNGALGERDLPVPTNEGHSFAGWFTAAEDGDRVTAETVVTNAVTFYAHWTVNTYTVAFDANGGVGGVTNEQDYASAIVAPEVTREGFAFTGWLPEVDATVPASNVTYVAQWTIKQYFVAFDANGGVGGVTNEQDYASEIVVPTVTREGYAVTGWEPEVDATVPASNVTYVAQWTINRYTVAFDANGGVGGVTNELDYASEIVVPTVTREGYALAGWEPEVDATVPASNVTYVAQWTVNQHTVTISLNGGEGEGSVVVDYGTKVGDIAVPTRTGYAFAGWFTAAEGGNPIGGETPVTGDMEIHAQWTSNAYTVEFKTNGGEGEMPEQLFTYDVEACLASNAFTYAGHVFAGWATNATDEAVFADGAAVSNLTTVADDVVTLYAVWKSWTVQMQVCEDAFGGSGTVALDDDGNVVVTLTNDVARTVELPDDIGSVTIDLDGHSIKGSAGGAAIRIVAGEGDGDTTRLTIVDRSEGEKGVVAGGDGESAGIEYADDASSRVRLDVADDVSVLNGDGSEQAWRELSPVERTLRVGEYFEKTTLAELGYAVPTNGTPYSVVAKGLPAGLKLKYNAAVKDKKGRITKKATTEWWIEGVPTAVLDFFTNPPYLVITTNGVAETYSLPLEVEAQKVTDLGELALGVSVNTNGWLTGVEKGWTVTGLPTGLKFATKKVTKKSGTKTVTVAEAYAVYGTPTKAGLFTITAKKKVNGYYETLKFEVFVPPAQEVDTGLFGENMTNITTMAYVPFEWYLTNDVSAVGGITVSKVTGLPAGLAFAAKDTYAYANAKKKTGKYLKQAGQTILGTTTKPGTNVVTFTKNVTTGTGKKKKTVAKTAQILWIVVENDAELELGFNTEGGVVESGVVGLNYGDLLTFTATSNATVKAIDLPAGIALANLGGGTYAFTGFTTKAGTYLVTVTATLNGKTVTQRLALKVEGLPTWAKGTYNGYVGGSGTLAASGEEESGESAASPRGLATVTVSAVGKISGKFYEGGTNWTLSAASYTAATSAAAPAGGDSVVAAPAGFVCTNVVAKYAYKVTETVKGKKKNVTKYVERTFTLAVAPGEFGGIATLTEIGVAGDPPATATTLAAWQNLWGSTYKSLGKKLFTSKSGKKTLAYTTFPLDVYTNEFGQAYFLKKGDDNSGLTYFLGLSLKVTTVGAVTATLTYDTGKTTKDKKTKKPVKVYYKPTCSTVLIPTSAADAESFTGVVPLYFAPSAGNGFNGFYGQVAYPFDGRSVSEQEP